MEVDDMAIAMDPQEIPKWLKGAAAVDPVAVEMLCHDTAELNALLAALAKRHKKKDHVKIEELAIQDPEISKASQRFAEHLVRLRKQYRGAMVPNEKLEVSANDLKARFDPNPDGTEGYLINEYGVYLLMATCLTDVGVGLRTWIAEMLLPKRAG
jgi:hypothetical protein